MEIDFARVVVSVLAFGISIGLMNLFLWAVGSPWRWWAYRKEGGS